MPVGESFKRPFGTKRSRRRLSTAAGRVLLAAQRGPAHKEAVRSFIEKREPRFNQA